MTKIYPSRFYGDPSNLVDEIRQRRKREEEKPAITANPLCPLCEEGHTTLRHAQTEVEYGGEKGLIETQYRRCDVCQSEIVGDREGIENKLKMELFEWQQQKRKGKK